MATTVIDLSHYQAGLSLAAFKAQGGLAVIAKASQGASSADPSFADWRNQAKANGLAFASYHYLDASDPAKQAAWYIKCAMPEAGERICADWEAAGVTVTMVKTFLGACALIRPDLELTVYSGAAAKAALGASTDRWLSDNTSLWLAQYTSGAPSWPSGTWKAYSLWQFSDKGSIGGIAVDLNGFNGSNANLLKWFGPSTASPAIAKANVTIQIAADRPINLIVNGVSIQIA
jgi:lysozyme